MIDFLDLKGAKITLCVSSSISFYKALELLSLLKKAGANVRVAMSENVMKFCSPLAFEALSGHKVLCASSEDWTADITHISYARCDLMIFAPASANTINKLSAGIADSVMLSCALACKSPKLLAPAMNTAMLENEITQNSLKKLKELGFGVIYGEEKLLACGEFGAGALAEPHEIALLAARMLKSKPEFQNKKVLITAGACYEMIDDVRAITNLSSGKMGFALALSFYLAGADVTLLSSASLPFSISGLEFQSFKTSAELKAKLENAKLKSDDLLVMAAAISDYVPLKKQSGKIKKSGQNLNLELKENIDILGSLKLKCKKIGFKMEMDSKTALNSALNMLEIKALNAVCLNIIDEKNYFGSEQNEVLFITRNSKTKLELASKYKIAEQIAQLSGTL